MKMYILEDKTGRFFTYCFNENEAQKTKEFVGKGVTIHVVNVKKLYVRRTGETVWQNLDDLKERIITAPETWDECIWFEYKDKNGKWQ
jgi:hypothetical protein